MFAESCNEVVNYEKIEAPLDGFDSAIQQFFNLEGALGCNVTVPFKQQAFMLTQERCDEAASLAGAVNTLKRNEDGTLEGFNTDGIGLVNDLYLHRVSLKDARILILGAGGAARGIIYPLLKEGVREIVIANRTHETARALADRVEDERVVAADVHALSNNAFSIVINSTSASLTGDVPDCGNIDFTRCQLAYDMVYGKQDTPFMVFAREQGAINQADGLGMLVEQAAAAFTLWTGKTPPTLPVIDAIRRKINA